MSDSSGGAVKSIDEPEAWVDEGDRGILLGAPGIGKSERLDDLEASGKATVVRRAEDLPEEETSRPLVLDNFYDLFSWYCRADPSDTQRFRDGLGQWLASESPILVCTTPYRLRWMLSEDREAFGELLGEPTEWTVIPIRVDREAAEAFLERELDGDRTWTADQLERTEWEYSLGEQLRAVLRSDEPVDDLLRGTTTYTTYVPGIIASAGSTVDVDAILRQRTSVLATVRTILGDLSAAEAIEEGTSLVDSATEFAGRVRDEGVIETAWNEIKGAMTDPPDIGIGTVAGLSAQSFVPVGCVLYWAWVTRRDDVETRKTVREEFQSILGGDVEKLSAADRELVEEEFGLPPRTLTNLHRMTSGVVWERLDGAVEDIERSHDRIDELEARVEAVERKRKEWLRERANRRKSYQTLVEFESDRLYDRPAYVPPECDVMDKQTSGRGAMDADVNAPGVEATEPDVDTTDAREAVVDVLERDEAAVVLLTGESGIGKTRLMIEVAERLRDEGRATVRFVEDPAEKREPWAEGDTVLFLDEVGRMDDPQYFFGLASPSRRGTNAAGTVQVVAAVRPVYYETAVNTGPIPESVAQYEIEVEPLDETRTSDLVSDLGVDAETARDIGETTAGNPFLSRLLARAEAGTSVEGRSTEAKLKDELFDETLLDEATELTDEAEALLTAVAVLNQYDVDAVGNTITELYGVPPGTQRQALDSLTNTGYLDSARESRPSGRA